MLGGDLGASDVIMTQEDLMEQKIIAQKKEKKIKIIRLISVFAYLVSVSLVAALLSAYYICIWNPRAANITIDTQTVNAERIMMALPTTGGEYAFDSTADDRYAGHGDLSAKAMRGQPTVEQSNSLVRSSEIKTTNIKLSTSRVQITAVVGNVPESSNTSSIASE